MKRTAAAVLAAALMGLLPIPAQGAQEPAVSAQSAVVMEADSGVVLWEKEADARHLIASTTKIMTALVVLERCEPDQVVTVDPAWTNIEGSSMYLAPGQQLTVEELLYGLMLASGNDAAVALACFTAGSVEDFAKLMNEKARELGCENTHFVNANGLDDPDHYASARDLALIARAALENEAFCRIVSCQARTVDGKTYVNHNRLLRECPGVFGVKTGYTMAAGRTLVSACQREGLTLLCVTLSDPDDWDDHKRLYDWAYGQYARDDVLAGAAWTVPVIGGTAEWVTVTPASALNVAHRSDDEIAIEYRLPAFVYADVAAGTPAGEAVAYVGGAERGRTALVFAGDVPRAEPAEPTLWQRVMDVFR